MQQNAAKDAASKKAVEFVKDGMILGLGTGSTARFFIQHLIERCKEGLKIEAVATSIASAELARAGGVPMLDINALTSLDLTVDGADEIDPEKRLIKGAGGALVREKIIANMSREMVVIADPSKLVDHLGKCPLPVEVVPFATEATRHHLAKLGYEGKWRVNPEGSRLVTDNGNHILDLTLPSPSASPEKIHAEIIHLPGVVDTGFFINLATRIVVGNADGSATLKT